MGLNRENAYIRQLSEEDRLLAARIADLAESGRKTSCVRFSFFLDERQCKIAQDILHSFQVTDYMFFGGFEGAKRKVLAVFPDAYTPGPEDFPITPLEFKYRNSDALTHRDFLGAILAQQIKREFLGDILVNEGETIVFAMDSVAEMLLNEITKIGSAGVKVRISEKKDFSIQENFQEITGTVASLRVDCVVSLATKLSREKAAVFIKSAGADINYKKSFLASTLMEEGDVFSLRGYGKYRLTEIGGLSKKGKIFVRIHKYS